MQDEQQAQEPRVKLATWTPDIWLGAEEYDKAEGNPQSIRPPQPVYEKVQDAKIGSLEGNLLNTELHEVFKSIIGTALQQVEMLNLSDKQEKAFKSTFKRMVWNRYSLLNDFISSMTDWRDGSTTGLKE